ncbi:PRS23 protease, partial [Polyodon spathula]|nr:PRS23 protease [Polyodon spathula]
ALKLPPGRTTVMHLVARETLPEPNSHAYVNLPPSISQSPSPSLCLTQTQAAQAMRKSKFTSCAASIRILPEPIGESSILFFIRQTADDLIGFRRDSSQRRYPKSPDWSLQTDQGPQPHETQLLIRRSLPDTGLSAGFARAERQFTLVFATCTSPNNYLVLLLNMELFPFETFLLLEPLKRPWRFLLGVSELPNRTSLEERAGGEVKTGQRGQGQRSGGPTLARQEQTEEDPRFSTQPQLDFTTYCNSSCYQQGELPPSRESLRERLAYETLYADGRRTLTTVDLEEEGEGAVAQPPPTTGRPVPAPHRRCKRQIYGADGRFNIRGNNFLLDYPFSTAVRISTGCTGVLVSESHVLTAAHCVHDGKDYVKGARKLRVGILVPPGNATRTGRPSSSARPVKTPAVRWVRVKRTRVPKGWIQGPQEISMDFDYSLLELRWPHKQPYMRLSVAPSSKDLAGKRIHFSGFDSDRPGELVYRFCPVEDESNDLIYQHCDARPGASGSGVYGRVWDPVAERWERKVIGVFSGHQWLEVNGENHDFNVAVRLTPLKFAQICYWVRGNHVDCQQD